MGKREINEKRIEDQEITITPEAAEQIRIIRRDNQVPDTHGLRIGIQSGGCCGYSYLLAFDDKAEAADKVLQGEGITIYVDERSLEGLTGTTIEYIEGPQGKGFRFNNPNQAQSCGNNSGGCGSGGCGDCH